MNSTALTRTSMLIATKRVDRENLSFPKAFSALLRLVLLR